MASVVGALGALGGYDARPWLPRLRMPAAVVVTARDKLVRPSQQLMLASALPDADVLVVDGGHACCVLGASRFVPVLAAAVDSVLRRGADRGRQLG